MTRTMVLCAATAFVFGALGTYVVTRPADAQDGTPKVVADSGPGDNMRPGPWGGPGHPGWGMMHGGMAEGFLRHRLMMAREWGLFAWTPDKHLTATDVQTIAQAILLHHGNHIWKVADVVQNQDNTVSFAYTSGDGAVIARFTMDTRTGRIQRTG